MVLNVHKVQVSVIHEANFAAACCVDRYKMFGHFKKRIKENFLEK